ncbi:hypothetical protein [uncultured Pelagimonas sp.]|uniref:hypothetical protein n=1 Tax=uncultured Pelagimonas sp. TaxID=1618102 RepID=UPI00261D4F65|nr:hypothetical protein [uncultured Pelagimonas sp.]
MHRWLLVIGLWVCGLGGSFAVAEQLPMDNRGSLLATRQPMFATSGAATTSPRNNSSLFAGQSAGSLLAPYPARAKPKPTAARFHLGMTPNTPLARIRHLIALAEAGKKGYDAVQHGAKRKPSKRPTDMTIQEIYTWIADTPGQQHAIGRYQFIPATLRRLVKKRGISRQARFDKKTQDALADVLLAEAGVHEVIKGELPRRRFMHNLAKIWAGLPTSNGESYYKGIAGNKATMSWSHFDQEMRRIFPG